MTTANSNRAEYSGRTAFTLRQRAVLFCVAYFCCAEASNYLSAPGTTYVSFWLPAGLYVAVLLMSGNRDWPWLVLATLPANLAFDLLHGSKPILIPFFFLANAVQAVGGAWLVRRFVAERPTLATLREFAGLLGFGAVLSTMAGAVIGATALVAFGLSHSFVQSWKVWWGSTAMAILLLSPFILTWFTKSDAPRPRVNQPKKLLEAVLLLFVLLAFTGYLLFADQGIMSPNKGWVLLPLLWAGLRFGSRGAAAANLLMSFLVAFFTTQCFTGLTPEQISSGEYVFVVQSSLAVAALVGLIPAIVLGERDRTMADLRESEEKFSRAFRSSPDALALTELETGRYIDINEGHERLFGFPRDEVIGRTTLEIGIYGDPEDRRQLVEALRAHGLVRDLELHGWNRRREPLIVLYSGEIVELGGKSCIVSVVHDITGRVRAERALRESEAKRVEAIQREQQGRAEYTLQLIAAQEAERTRIAAELHDSLGQNLLIIKNRAQLALTEKTAPAAARAQLEGISSLASQAIAEVRQISHDLHPYQLDHLGLTRALEAMIESTAQASGIVFERKLDAMDSVFPADAATNLYRVVQESLNNILKHSRAKRVRIELARDVREVQLRIEDDGCGFRADETGNGGKGLGLKNIAERVRILNGKLKVDSQPDLGTRIEVTIPIAEIG